MLAFCKFLKAKKASEMLLALHNLYSLQNINNHTFWVYTYFMTVGGTIMFDCTPTYLYKVIYSNCMLSLIVTLHKDCSEICGPTLQTLPTSGIYMCWLRTLAAADTCQCGYSSNTEAWLTMCRPVGRHNEW